MDLEEARTSEEVVSAPYVEQRALLFRQPQTRDVRLFRRLLTWGLKERTLRLIPGFAEGSPAGATGEPKVAELSSLSSFVRNRRNREMKSPSWGGVGPRGLFIDPAGKDLRLNRRSAQSRFGSALQRTVGQYRPGPAATMTGNPKHHSRRPKPPLDRLWHASVCWLRQRLRHAVAQAPHRGSSRAKVNYDSVNA